MTAITNARSLNMSNSVTGRTGNPSLLALSGSKAGLSYWLLPLAIIVRLTILLRRRSMDDYQVIDGYAVLQVAIVAVTLAAIAASGKLGNIYKRLRNGSAKWFILFYCFGAISAAWSPGPAFSLYRALEYLSQVMVVFVALACCNSFLEAERRVLIVSTIAMGLTIYATIRWSGFSIKAFHTNQYTVHGMMIFCYCWGEIISGLRKDVKLLKIFAGIGLVCTIIGTSSASYLSLVLGVMVAALLTRYRARLMFLVACLAFIVICLGGPGVLLELIFYGKSAHQVATLSGRSVFWMQYLEEFQKSPIIGYGYAISARISSIQRTNTHNSFFSVVLSTGIMGLLIVTVSSCKFLGEALRAVRHHYPGSVGGTAALIAAVFNSMGVALLCETWMNCSLPFVCFFGLFALHTTTADSGVTGGVQRLILRRISPRPRIIVKESVCE